MALTLTAKAPGEVFDYTWLPPFDADDGLASYTASASGCTIDSAGSEGDEITLFLSGGTAATTAVITLTAVSTGGRTYNETLYLPIRTASNALSYTVRDVCGFALRKIVGNGSDADSAELVDAVERLNDMAAEWAAMGADLGVPLPLSANDTIYASDAFVSAIKHNLRIACHEHYGQPIDATDARAAMRGLQLVKVKNLPAEREGAEFY